MAGAVGNVTKVVELALKIKEAVDTVRQNRKDCAYIKRRVERVRRTLSLCEGNAELMESPAVRDAVEALAEVLGEALELVTACQEETNAVCLCCTAGKLSKQLGKIDRGISDGNSEATFAILVYHISKQAGDGAGPATPTETEEIPQPIVVNETEYAPQSSFTEQTQPASLSPTTFEMVAGAKKIVVSPDRMILHILLLPQVFRRERPSEDGFFGYFSVDDEDDYGGDGALLQEIARVTLAIRTALETVRRNKDECIEIDKRASRASVLLSQLEDKETTRDTAVRGALKSLLRTFRFAHELVEACQRRSVLVLCSSGNLSSDLRRVLDRMMLDLDHLIDVLP